MERIGHIRRDGTALLARERPVQSKAVAVNRSRPRRGESRPPAKESPIDRPRQQTLAQSLKEIPSACDRRTKCNAQGDKVSGNDDKLHLDTRYLNAWRCQSIYLPKHPLAHLLKLVPLGSGIVSLLNWPVMPTLKKCSSTAQSCAPTRMRPAPPGRAATRR